MLIRTNDVFACHYAILDVYYDVEASCCVHDATYIFLHCQLLINKVIISYDLWTDQSNWKIREVSKEGVDFIKLIGPDWLAQDHNRMIYVI